MIPSERITRTEWIARIALAMALSAVLSVNAVAQTARPAIAEDDAWKKAGADDGLRQAFERAIYSFKDSGHGVWRGGNHAQRLSLEFDATGARLRHPDGSIGLHLKGYGYGGKLRQPAPAKLAC